MKLFIVRSLEVISYIGFFAFIVAGAGSGYQRAVEIGGAGAQPFWGAIVGAVLGFVAAVVVFGVLFLLLDIAENTRRTRELLERRP